MKLRIFLLYIKMSTYFNTILKKTFRYKSDLMGTFTLYKGNVKMFISMAASQAVSPG